MESIQLEKYQLIDYSPTEQQSRHLVNFLAKYFDLTFNLTVITII